MSSDISVTHVPGSDTLSSSPPQGGEGHNRDIPICQPSPRKSGGIAPHPELTAAQARAIAIDYGIRGKTVTIPVKRALLFYALKRLGLDVAPGTRPPHEQHIVLVNRKEIVEALVRRGET